MTGTTAAAANKPPNLFGNRFFQTILLSNVLLQIGIWVRNFAILMYVTDMTNEDPIAISLISIAEFAPIFIFSFIGGAFADRWRPKRTMIWCDFLSAASVFVVLLTLIYGAWETIFFATLVSAILSQFSQPSAMRMFKSHLAPEQLQQAMAFFQSLVAIFMVGGPALGIWAYHQFGIEKSVAVMGVAFLLSALVLFRLPEAEEEKSEKAPEERSLKRELGEGLRYVWRSPVLKWLGVTFALAGLAVGVVQAMGIFVVTEKLGKPKEFLQYVMMINGAAMLVGGGLVAGLARKVAPQKLLAVGMAFGAVTNVLIGFSMNVPFTLAMCFIGGLAFPAIHIGISTMILQWSEQSIVGRVNGVLSPMFIGTMVVMMSISGVLKKAMPLEAIYTISGVLMFFGMLVLVPLFKHKPPAEAQTRTAESMPMH
jgi:MFS transporter, DHA3 family, macrolide efflux protein